MTRMDAFRVACLRHGDSPEEFERRNENMREMGFLPPANASEEISDQEAELFIAERIAELKSFQEFFQREPDAHKPLAALITEVGRNRVVNN